MKVYSIIISICFLILLTSCSMQKLVMKGANSTTFRTDTIANYEQMNSYQKDFTHYCNVIESAFPYFENSYQGDSLGTFLIEEELDPNYRKKDFFANLKDPKSIYYMSPPKQKFKGNVYVLTSARSASAATMFPVLMQDNGFAKVVGIPPANRPTGATVVLPMALPHTGITFSVSTNYLTRPDATKHHESMLQVDHLVRPTMEDYFAGKDAALSYILDSLNTAKK